MASMTFMPYVDKENAVSHGFHSSKGQHSTSKGLGGGKVFTNSIQKSLVTPRRALGDVSNRGMSVNSNTQGTKQQKAGFKPPVSQQKKGLKLQGNKENNLVQTKSVTKEKTLPVETEFEDIEHMHIPKDIEDDDFEDIWPKSERISTYITKLISWRPPCLFGDLPGSEDEGDEEEEHLRRMKDLDAMLDKMPKPATSICDQPELSDDGVWELEPLEDIPFPSADRLCEISLPLDDSSDILSSMGELRIQDSP